MKRVSTFTYKGVPRVAIEQGPDPREGAGLLCMQLKPEKGIRTFKPGLMMDCKKLGFFQSLWYYIRSMRVVMG